MNRTEWLHPKPLTHIQYRSIIQFLLRNSAAVFLVRIYPPQTHVA